MPCPGWSTTTPRSISVATITRTSSISGTFVKRQRSPGRAEGAGSWRAAFLAPLTRTVPESGRPPSIRKSSRATGSGVYSQWNGRASAMAVPRPRPALPAPMRPLPVAALGDPDPDDGGLQLGPGLGQVDGLHDPPFQ